MKREKGKTDKKLDKLTPPSRKQETLICQIIASGFLNQIARLQTTANTGNFNTSVMKSGRAAYLRCDTNTIAFIHPSSSTKGKGHEYVCYGELVVSTNSDTNNMKIVTHVDPAWLPIIANSSLCSFSAPLDFPPPMYDPKIDSLTCYVYPSYGPHKWTLPITQVKLSDVIGAKHQHVFIYFARFLLEGKVFPKLAQFVPYLSTKTSVFAKPWASKKVTQFVETLKKNEICSKADLLKKWNVQRDFLLNEYIQWVSESHQNKLKQEWPPI